MTQSTSITVTIPNPTAGQLAALTDILNAVEQNETSTENASKVKRGRGRPAKTVSEDEDEEFGTKPLGKKDLKNDEDEDEETEASESDEDEDESNDGNEEEDDEEEGLSFDTVKAAINKYGEKKPDDMKAILASFGFKGTKQLSEAKPSKWQAVYDKVQAKLKKKK